MNVLMVYLDCWCHDTKLRPSFVKIIDRLYCTDSNEGKSGFMPIFSSLQSLLRPSFDGYLISCIWKIESISGT